MDPTPENAPCWQDRYRPREICEYECMPCEILYIHACIFTCMYLYLNKYKGER